ncbi:MAG: homoserine O-acetyltransferase [Alphaproteobacteria bacterium]|nr:homoserine O-acetyltransferase [Alphaproteobacteria bacterium]
MRRLMLIGCLALPAMAAAQEGSVGIVEKRVFSMPSYTTVGGATIRDVKVGWEAYGQLNAARDNVVIVPHFFTGNSHAAGKYKPEDAAPGYWDAIIGPGKAIDTGRFYVVAVDSLVNLNTKDPNTTTTGPATTNPDTGKPWGMAFPIVTMRDFVNVQKALLDSLGVTRVHAAIGASMGSMQALEWAAAYPDLVQRVAPVIGVGEADAWTIGRVELWAQAITLDPNWNNGDYYGRAEPTAGLALALKLVTLDARHWGWADKAFGRKLAKEGDSPLASWNNRYAITATLDAVGAARARTGDANHFLYLVRANQLFVAGHENGGLEAGLARIKAKALFLPAKSDLLLAPENARKSVDILRRLGKQAEMVEIDGDGGHLDGVLAVSRVGPQIRRFMD